MSIATYYPRRRRLEGVLNVSWHTADGTVSSQRVGVGGPALGGGWPGPFLSRTAPRLSPHSWWGLCVSEVLSSHRSLRTGSSWLFGPLGWRGPGRSGCVLSMNAHAVGMVATPPTVSDACRPEGPVFLLRRSRAV